MHPVFALSLQGTLKDIGALAGLVAIPGVAVLALLYFAQAREVKRLREWAGRAPERAAELQSRVVGQATGSYPAPTQPPRRVVPQPVQRPATPAQPATGAHTPAGSAPANAGGQPPAGAPRPATPAATPGPAEAPSPASQPAGGSPSPPEPVPAPAGSAAGKPDGPPAPAAVPAPAATAAPATGGSVAGPAPAAAATPGKASPTAPPRPPGSNTTSSPAARREQPAPPMAGAVAVKAPSGASPGAESAPRPATAPLRTSAPSATMPPPQSPRRPGLRAMGPRGAAIISAVVLAAVVVGVIVLTSLGGGGAKSSSGSDRVDTPSQNGSVSKPGRPSGPVSRGDTTVSVLNGTTTPGLAANVSDQLQRGGFKRGSVTNAADQQRPQTLVNYAPGFKTQAEEIAKLLKLKSVSPIDPGTQAIAGANSQVVVTVGTDRTQ